MDSHPEKCECPACDSSLQPVPQKIVQAVFSSDNGDVAEVLEAALTDVQATECLVVLLYHDAPYHRIYRTEISIIRAVGILELAKHEMLNYKTGVTDE